MNNMLSYVLICHSLTSFCALYQFLIPQESAAIIRKIKTMHRLFKLLDLNNAR